MDWRHSTLVANKGWCLDLSNDNHVADPAALACFVAGAEIAAASGVRDITSPQ